MKCLKKLFHGKCHYFKSKDDFEHFWETMKFVAEMEAAAEMKKFHDDINDVQQQIDIVSQIHVLNI